MISRPIAFAGGAILLWASLATLGAQTRSLPLSLSSAFAC